MLKINPKIRSDEQIDFLKAFLQEKNFLEILIKNKTQEIDKPALLDCFSRYMEIQTAQKNEVLFHIGDNAEKFFIVLKGSVEISIPEKKKIWLSRWEYYKSLEKILYEEEITLVKSILNSNYEKVSFECYDDFFEFAKAKAKIAIKDKFNTVKDKNSLINFYQQNSKILKIFKIADEDDFNYLNYFPENKCNLASESKEKSFSEEDEFNSESDDDEQHSKSISQNFKLNEDNKEPNRMLKLDNNHFLMLTANKPNEFKKNIQISNLDINESITQKTENNLTKNENLSKCKNNNSKTGRNIKKNFHEKNISKTSDSPFKINENVYFKKIKKEILCEFFELTIKELEILKKYSLIENDSYKLKYFLFSTKKVCLREKEYFGDFALEDKNKKRTATVKCCENNTILGFIKTEVYNENIFNRNQKNNFKNMQMLNDISFFKDISLANFQSFCYDRFEIRKFVKNETLMESNSQSSEILIIKEGKADVTLYANIFDIQNIIDEILKIFPINNDNLIPEDMQLIKVLKYKKIFHNSFNQKQKDNLMIKKNVNLFSLERSGIVGLEHYFLKMKSFFKVITVSEKLSAYTLSDENLNKIFTQYPDCRSNYDKLALKKCLVALSRLNEIKNSIMNLSNLKYNNSPLNNYFGDHDSHKNKIASSKDKISNIKMSKYATSGNLPNIRFSIINEDSKEYLKKNPSIKKLQNLNRKIINRNNSSFTNNTNNQFSNIQNNSIQNDNSKFMNSEKKNSALKIHKIPDEVNELNSDEQNNKIQSPIFKNNLNSNKSGKDLDDYYSLGTKIHQQANFRTSMNKCISNYSKSTTDLPFLSPSKISNLNVEKVKDRVNSIKCEDESINLQEKSIEKNFNSSEKNALIDLIKISKEIKINNEKNKGLNSLFNESQVSKLFKSPMNFKSYENKNNCSINEQAKLECLNSNTNFREYNESEDDIEENLFPFNKKLFKKTSRKLSLEENTKNANDVYNYNKNKNQQNMFTNKKNSIENNKFTSMNAIQKVKMVNSNKGLNQMIKTHGNFKNFKKSNDNVNFNIVINNFSNIYNYGAENPENEKISLDKTMKNDDHQNKNLSPNIDNNFMDNVNNDFKKINSDLNTLNDDKNCQHVQKCNPVILNKTAVNFNKNEINLSQNNGNENNGKQEPLNKPLAIKLFQDIDFDDKIPKTQTSKNSFVNIQNLRNRIKISSVKKIMLSKN